MCFYEQEGEVCPIYNVTHPRSRRERKCVVCCATIKKGEHYERHDMLFDERALEAFAEIRRLRQEAADAIAERLLQGNVSVKTLTAILARKRK